jgi:DNA-binding transcriptional LysR family regulator
MLAQELHFRKAAEKLYISQSALSKQIMQLERLLECQLFSREKKKIKLSPSGIFLRDQLVNIYAGFDKMLENLEYLNKGMVGKINIGFVGSAMQNIIPKLLITAKDHYPEIKFSLDELSISDQIKKLENGSLDIGFVRLSRIDEPLKLHPIYEDSFSLVVPADYPIKSINKKAITSLNRENFILFEQSYSPMYYEKIMSICDELALVPQVSHTSVHAGTIFRLVENKMGISIVPSTLADGFDMKIKLIPLKKIRHKAILSMAWNTNNLNPCLSNVLKLMEI